MHVASPQSSPNSVCVILILPRLVKVSNKISRLVKVPTSLGISPVSLAYSSDRAVRRERYPISVGIVPSKKCP
jgi:hypothetical protein